MAVKKARDLIGLPVVETSTGEQVGEVRDVLFAPEGGMYGLLLQKSGLLSAAKVLRKERVQAFGSHAITIPARDDITDLREGTGMLHSLIQGQVPFVGKDVLTQTGTLLGTVEDVYMDDDWHRIVGYEISEGFLVDLKEGRKVLHAHPEIMLGMDTMLVPEDLELAEEF
jgi:uncharacterized protein YrrD